jgi:hypothetical protein
MSLPKRPSTYFMILLLLALAGLVWWLNSLLSKVEEKAKLPAPEPYQPPPALADSGKPAGIYYGTMPTAEPQIDPSNQTLADQLNSPDSTPQQDLQTVASFIELYRRAFKSGNPIGENMDITAAITGTANPKQPGRVFPPRHHAIRSGQLVDRWGTPYWFHPESAFKMEIRSAGPDKSLFTEDDIVMQ